MSERPTMRTPGGPLPGFPAARQRTPAAEPAGEPPVPAITDDDAPALPGPAAEPATAATRPAAPIAAQTKSKRTPPGAEVGERPRRLDVELELKNKYQAQFYGLTALRRHYERIVFELKQDGESTSLSELFNAVLLHGPRSPDEARELLRELRRTP